MCHRAVAQTAVILRRYAFPYPNVVEEWQIAVGQFILHIIHQISVRYEGNVTETSENPHRDGEWRETKTCQSSKGT